MKKNMITLILAFILSIPLSLPAQEKDCSNTYTGLIPINDLGTDFYFGLRGGLYPGGINDRPEDHEQAGIDLSRMVAPLDPDGYVDPESGKIVLMSIGMSNTFMEFERFIQDAGTFSDLHPNLVLFNGAQGGISLEQITSMDDPYWDLVERRLMREGLDPKQVQAIWLKQVYHSPASPDLLENTQLMAIDLARVVVIIKSRFPNVLLGYVTSRIYGGYTSNELRNEPGAYESAFGFQLLIRAQIDGALPLNYDPKEGPVRSPWLSWGPYMWADGLVPRSDGLTWECDDFDDDGFHSGEGAEAKMSSALIEFFRTDPTTIGWFLEPRAMEREDTAD